MASGQHSFTTSFFFCLCTRFCVCEWASEIDPIWNCYENTWRWLLFYKVVAQVCVISLRDFCNNGNCWQCIVFGSTWNQQIPRNIKHYLFHFVFMKVFIFEENQDVKCIALVTELDFHDLFNIQSVSCAIYHQQFSCQKY